MRVPFGQDPAGLVFEFCLGVFKDIHASHRGLIGFVYTMCGQMQLAGNLLASLGRASVGGHYHVRAFALVGVIAVDMLQRLKYTHTLIGGCPEGIVCL